jgi:hypothetical protein
MKNSAAFKPWHSWFPFLAVAVPCLWGLVFWLRDWPLATIAAFMSAYLVHDAWNLVKTKRATDKEPVAPEKNVPGT